MKLICERCAASALALEPVNGDEALLLCGHCWLDHLRAVYSDTDGPASAIPFGSQDGEAKDHQTAEAVSNLGTVAELLEGPGDWRAEGLCGQADPDAWFPDPGVPAAAAVYAACMACPVRAQCLAAALVRGERYGVWGGLRATDRIPLRRALLEGVPAAELVARGLAIDPTDPDRTLLADPEPDPEDLDDVDNPESVDRNGGDEAQLLLWPAPEDRRDLWWRESA